MEKKTPLYDAHVALGGKMVPFAGYLLPVQYQGTGVIKEHLAVREAAGLFDVSHMGEVVYEGPTALANLQQLLTNDFTNLAIGRVRYSLMCDADGGILDDLLVYRQAEDKFLIVVNAANREKDVAFMQAHLFGEVVFQDISDEVAQLALQGPRAKDIIRHLVDETQLPDKYYSFKEKVAVGGIPCLLSRTGYTGEFGYELYTAPENAQALWQLLLTTGAEYGLVPCGLGARDTLRLEAAMPLYGHEMTEATTPFDVGLDFAIKMTKNDFIGKTAIAAQGEPAKMRIGLVLTERGIAREGAAVYRNAVKIGETTSGTMCPYVKKACAMASVKHGSVSVGDALEVEIRGKKLAAKVVALPFFKK